MSDHEPELFGDFPRRYLDDWERLAEPTLKGKKLSTLVDKGPDGVTVEPLQTRQSWPTHKDPAGLPGFFPYIRGGTADGTHRGWDVRQSYADPDTDRLVAALRQDLAAGVTRVALDLPSL
ncbi:MAG: methylmalonyl-CoA mutase family protein, partial [Deltaproteobacteria bacterium]